MNDTNTRPAAVLLIAHGSRRAEANADLFDLAARLERHDSDSIVVASFLELAEPSIADGGARCVERGAKRVLLIPYFLSTGVHLVRDLTDARDDLIRRFPNVRFTLGPALGPHPLLDELVRRRIVETEADPSRIDGPTAGG